MDDAFIDLDRFVGTTTYSAVEYISPYTGQTASVPLPDLGTVFRFIILLVIVRYFLKSIFSMVRFFG